jgi:hypothetical protein
MDCHVMRACCELIAAFKWSDDLRAPKYRGNPNVQAGHCYVASEVLRPTFRMMTPRAKAS